MKKTYYKESNGYIEMSTTNTNVAKRNGCTLTTTEEIVMQGDGSGYVLASKYIAPDTRIDALNKDFDECIAGLKDYMVEAQLMDDEELQEEIKAEYISVVAEYDKQIEEMGL